MTIRAARVRAIQQRAAHPGKDIVANARPKGASRHYQPIECCLQDSRSPLTLSLSPSDGERVALGRVRGIRASHELGGGAELRPGPKAFITFATNGVIPVQRCRAMRKAPAWSAVLNRD